jgi:carbon starvation protein
MVIVFYLWRRNKPIWFALGPLALMVILPAWAMLWNMFNPTSGWCLPLIAMIGGDEAWVWSNDHLLLAFGVAILVLQTWTVIEAVSLWSKAKGVLEEALPPLGQPAMAGARSC